MGIGSSDGQYYEDELSFHLDSVAPGRPRVYITGNTPENDGTTPPTMPPGGSTEPAGALFSEGGTQTPENTSREEIRPTPDYMNPPEGVGSFRPRASSIIKDFVTGIVDGIKLFSGKEPTWAIDPASGEIRTDPRVIEKVMNAGELATFGPGVLAGKAADGTLGSFIGAKAFTWDKNAYAHANILEKQGVNPDEILRQTGMFRGVDKKWRTEISDFAADIDPDWASAGITKPTRHELENAVRDMAKRKHIMEGERFATKEELQMYMDDPLGMYEVFDPAEFSQYFPGWKFNHRLEMQWTGKGQANLEDVYKHPELYKAYPQLKDVQLIEDPNYKGIAEASFFKNTIRYNRQNVENSTVGDLRSIMGHEIQHFIQYIEGFAKGGSPAEIAEGVYKLKHQLTEAQLKEADNIIKGLVNKFKEQGLDEVEFKTLERLEKIIKVHGEYVKAADRQAYENYFRLAGEVEARNVQTRMDLYPEELRQYPPSGSMDIAAENQLVESKSRWGTAYGLLEDDGTIRPVPRPQMAVDPIHLRSKETAKIRLDQLLRDKAASKKAGDDVEGSDYMFYNNQIRELREFLKQ